MSALSPLALAAWSFVKAHWRPILGIVVVSTAFLAGRCSVSKPSVKTVTQVQTVYKDRVVTQVVEKKAEQKTQTVVVYRDRVVHKDGSSETKEKVEQVTGDQSTDDMNVQQIATSEGKQVTAQTVTVKPAAVPNWYVGASLGVPVALKAPYVGTPFVVLDVSRRVVGPLSAGVWGSLDVKGQNPALGLSVGVTLP